MPSRRGKTGVVEAPQTNATADKQDEILSAPPVGVPLRTAGSSDPLGASTMQPSVSFPGEAMSRGPSRRTMITFDDTSAASSPRVSYDVRRPNMSRMGSEGTVFLADDGSIFSKTPASSTVKLADLPKRPPLSRGNTERTVQENIELGPTKVLDYYGENEPLRPPNSRGVSERSIGFVEKFVPYKDSRPSLGARGLSNTSKISTGNLESAFDEDEDEMADQVPEHITAQRLHNPRSGAAGSDQFATTSASLRRRSSQPESHTAVDDWAHHGHNRADLSRVGGRRPRLSYLRRLIDFFEPVTFHPEELQVAQDTNKSKSELLLPSVSMDPLGRDIPSARTSAVESINKSDGELDSKTSSQAQGRPILLPSLWAEIMFVMVCSSGQFLFQSLLGSITCLQRELVDHTFHMSASQAPWVCTTIWCTT